MIDKDGVNRLNQYIDKCINEYKGFQGATYGIITNKDKCFNCFGSTYIGDSIKEVRIDTIFDLASLTKVIATTTAVMKLVEKGQISLYEDVKDILPDFRYRNIKIHHLLTHTSGLPPEPKYRHCKSRNEVLNSLYATEVDYNNLDNKVVYSDTGFMLLGLIIDKVTGSFEKYVKENIFKPLNMLDTSFNPDREKARRCAATEFCSMRNELVVGKVHDEKAYLMDGVAGHAGLFSTVKDLGNFGLMILNDGIYNYEKILNKDTVDLLFKCQTEDMKDKRGYGWQIYNYNSTIYHTGFTGTSILIDKKHNISFILLTNRVYPTRKNEKLIELRGKINEIALKVVRD
jgi:CubicO group peptidase (beta-lactamase class C family)